MKRLLTTLVAALPMAALAVADTCPARIGALPFDLVVDAGTVFTVVNDCYVDNSLTVAPDGELDVTGRLVSASTIPVDIGGRMAVLGSGSFYALADVAVRAGGSFYLEDAANLIIAQGATFSNAGRFELAPVFGSGLFGIDGSFVNEAGGTLSLTGTRNFELSGTLVNKGTLTVDNGFQLRLDAHFVLDPGGTVINNSIIGNDFSAPLVFNGTLVNNGLVSTGVLQVAAGAHFTNNVTVLGSEGDPWFAGWQIDVRGTYDNNATLTLGVAGAPVLNLYSGATFNNNGTLKLFNTNELVVPAGASFVNTGTLVISDPELVAGGGLVTVGGRLENHGLIRITSPGQLTLDSTSSYDFTGGTILLDGGGTLLLRTDLSWGDPRAGTLAYVDLIQAGTVINEAHLVNLGGHFAQNNGAFINRGRFDNQGTYVLWDYLMGSRNEAGATLTNASGAEFNLVLGQFGNEGSIVNAGSLYVSGQAELVNNGSLRNQGIVYIEAGPAGRLSGSGTYQQAGIGVILHLSGQMVQSRVQIDDNSVLYGEGSVQGDVFVDGAQLTPGTIYHGVQILGLAAARMPSGVRHADAATTGGNTLTIDGNLSFVDSLLAFGIAGDGQFDSLHVTGHASFAGGTLRLVFADGYRPAAGTQWLLITADGGSSGLASLAPSYSGLPDGYGFSLSLGDGGLVVTVASVAAVPEPGAVWLLAAGLIAGMAWQRRRVR